MIFVLIVNVFFMLLHVLSGARRWRRGCRLSCMAASTDLLFAVLFGGAAFATALQVFA